MVRIDLSDDEVLRFALVGINAAEIAAYTGTCEAVAQARMNRLLREYANPLTERREIRWVDGKARAAGGER